MLLSNRVAIITGGATGMGRATAVLFAEEGCDVAIADIKMKEANETLNLVKEKGREGLAPPYHASKAGVVGLTNDLVRELSPYNIHANAILPGPIQTPFWDMIVAARTDGTEEAKDTFFKEMGKAVPLGRVGTAEEIAKAVLFLASDLSSYVTGAILPVAGGLPIMFGRRQE